MNTEKLFLKSKGVNAQTFYNFLSMVIRSGISFLTMPLFTRLLGAEQYGLYSVYHSWLLILTCVMGLNVGAGLGTGYYKFKKEYYQYKSSTLLEGTLISAVIIFILLALYPLLSGIILYPFAIFAILLMEAFAQFVLNLSSVGWVYEKRASANMLVSLGMLISTTVLSIGLLLNWRGGAENLYCARVLGNAIPGVMIAGILGIYIFKSHPMGYCREYWEYSLMFGLPMVFHSLSQQILGQADRVMMQKFEIDGTEIGIYSFFYTFTGLLLTILLALNNSWCPFLYDRLNRKSYSALDQAVRHYVQIFTVLCLGFLMFSREVAQVFANEEYWSGLPLIPVLVLVIYCTYIYQFAVNYEFFKSQPRIVAVGTVIAGVLNIILNSVMIPHWGMYGAVGATLLSYVTLALMHFIVVKHWKLEKYPLKILPVIWGLGMVIIGCGAYWLLEDYRLLRWGIGGGLGIHLLYTIYRRRKIF